MAFQELTPVRSFKQMMWIDVPNRIAAHNFDQEKIRVCRNHLFHQDCMSHQFTNLYNSSFKTHLTAQVSVSRILNVLSLEIVNSEQPLSSNSTPRKFFFEIFSFFFSKFSSLLYLKTSMENTELCNHPWKKGYIISGSTLINLSLFSVVPIWCHHM